MPHPSSGDYVVSWLDALSVQGAGWIPEFYSDPPRPSHYSPDTRPFVDHAFDAFAPAFHQEPSTMHHYQTPLGAPIAHSNSSVNTLYRHNAYAGPIASVSVSHQQHQHRGPSPVFYEEQSPPLPFVQTFPDFGFGDADSVPSMSSASSVTDNESVSACESRRRQKSKIALAADQPLTVDGKPRERVYVACDRWYAFPLPSSIPQLRSALTCCCCRTQSFAEAPVRWRAAVVLQLRARRGPGRVLLLRVLPAAARAGQGAPHPVSGRAEEASPAGGAQGSPHAPLMRRLAGFSDCNTSDIRFVGPYLTCVVFVFETDLRPVHRTNLPTALYATPPREVLARRVELLVST